MLSRPKPVFLSILACAALVSQPALVNMLTSSLHSCSFCFNLFEILTGRHGCKAVVIDVGMSCDRNIHAKVDCAPTLTRTGCYRHDYWITTKGGHMDVYDMEFWFGIPRGIYDYERAGCSAQQYAAMLGNFVCWPSTSERRLLL